MSLLVRPSMNCCDVTNVEETLSESKITPSLRSFMAALAEDNSSEKASGRMLLKEGTVPCAFQFFFKEQV